MKYLMKYENTKSKQGPSYGDYVIIELSTKSDKPNPLMDILITKDYIDFVENNIGKITSYSYKYEIYTVLYEKSYSELTSKNDKDWMMKKAFYFPAKDIYAYSKNKKEIEAILASKKYNM